MAQADLFTIHENDYETYLVPLFKILLVSLFTN